MERGINMMKIGIIGAGSIGLLFASQLSEGFTVIIYTRTKKQAEEINENGIIVWKEMKAQRVNVKAIAFDQWKGEEEITILAVKQYQLNDVLIKMKQFNKNINHLLFLQNGMGHLKLLPEINADNIYLGSIEHGAFKENSFTVRHNGEGITNLAVFKGDSTFLSEIASMFPADFPAIIQENYYKMLLNKLVINAVINPLTAVLQVRNGELIKNQYYFQVLKDLFLEISQVLNLKNSEEYLQKIIRVCQNTSSNRSSMLKDLESGRQTEVDAILGFLLEERKNQDDKLILSLYNFIKGKESPENF